MVASRVTFVGVNNEAHGRVSNHGLVSGHGCVSGHGRISRLHYSCMSRLRPWSRLSLGAFSFTLIAFGFSIFPFTVLLESGFKSLFFSNFMIVGIYCGCSTNIYVPCSSLDSFIFPLVEAEEINFLLFTYLLCLRKLFF